MERLRKWFGSSDVKSSDPKNVSGSITKALEQDGASEVAAEVKENPPSVSQLQKTERKADPKPESSVQERMESEKVTETRVGQLVGEGREMMLRVVPLAEGDCLSCKLVGSGAMWGAAAFVLGSYPKMVTEYTGVKRKLCALQVGSLATVLTLLGVARFFDLSIFSPPDTDGKRKSLGELISEDMDSASKVTSKLFSSNADADSRSKQDS